MIWTYVHMYRVFIKYCVFFQELSIFWDLFFVSTGLLLAVQKLSSNKNDCTLGSLARMSCSTCRGWHSFSQATLKWPEHPKIWSKTPFLWHNFGYTLSKWPQATLNFKIWGAVILRPQILVFLQVWGMGCSQLGKKHNF